MAHMKRVDQLLVMGALVEEEVIAIKRKTKTVYSIKRNKRIEAAVVKFIEAVTPGRADGL
jgi:hypothetical protein